MATGPSCGVSTRDEATAKWLTEALLDCEECVIDADASRESWWSHFGGQSETGILLKVKTLNEEERGISVTEMLLYAADVMPDTALPTPLASSFPAPPDADVADAMDQGEKMVKVYALPLCSNNIDCVKLSIESYPQIPIDFQNAGQAYFLPNTHGTAQVPQPAHQKRQSISTLFDDATKKRKKLKGRGGESISQAMAGIDRPPSQHGLPEKQQAPQPQQHDPRTKSLPRVSSMTSVPGLDYSRPASRSGSLAHGKRLSLHRVESVVSPRESPGPLDSDGSHAQQNKDALTKVIMAAMRLHGLQQKKKPASKTLPQSQATLRTETNAAATEAEDEYKLVYHQTFKSATFTFRKHLNAKVIPQEAMRDIVDQLLMMFCTDPLNMDSVTDGGDLQSSAINNGFPSSSPFDKPSSQARSSNLADGWNTPMVKKQLTSSTASNA